MLRSASKTSACGLAKQGCSLTLRTKGSKAEHSKSVCVPGTALLVYTEPSRQYCLPCRLKGSGWPKSMYGISKLCETTYTRVLAEQLKAKGVMVNACCPGYVDTDMTSHRGVKTLEQGADTPVWLALMPPGRPTGKLFAERKQIPF